MARRACFALSLPTSSSHLRAYAGTTFLHRNVPCIARPQPIVRPARFVCTSAEPKKAAPSGGGKLPGVAIAIGLSALVSFLLLSPLFLLAWLFAPFFAKRSVSIHKSLVALWRRLTLNFAFIRINLRMLSSATRPPSRALYVANHSSVLDLFALSVLPIPAVLAVPDRALKVPFLGWALQRAGWLGIDVAGGRAAQMAALSQVAKALEKDPVAIFPEGTPRSDGPMKRIVGTIVSPAREAGVPVVPVSIVGTSQMHKPKSVLPSSWPKSGIEVCVHDAVSTQGKQDKEIATEAWGKVLEGLPAEKAEPAPA